MTLLLDDDQELLRTSIVDILDREYSATKVRATVEAGAGYDRTAWARLAREFNLPGICIPETYGGGGADQRTRAVVLAELGARLAPTPYFGTAVLFADALLLADDEAARRELLPAIASGERLGAAALAEGDALWSTVNLQTRATGANGVWSITGTKTLVIDGMAADDLIVTADDGAGPALFLVAADHAAVRREPLPSTDLTRDLAEVVFTAAPARRLQSTDVAGLLERLGEQAAVALSAEMLGGLRRSVEIAVDYAKMRYQFGRQIGSFQAVKHRIADMYVRVELATAAVRNAAAAADGVGDDLGIAAALTLSRLSDFYRRTGDDLIHVHGGIGYTWEHDAHLYYRRAISSAGLLGSRDHHLDRLADLLGV